MEVDPRIVAARERRKKDIDDHMAWKAVFFRPVRPPPVLIPRPPVEEERHAHRSLLSSNERVNDRPDRGDPSLPNGTLLAFQLAKRIASLQQEEEKQQKSVTTNGLQTDGSVKQEMRQDGEEVVTRRETAQRKLAVQWLNRNPYLNKEATGNPMATMILAKIPKQMVVEREDLRLYGEQFGRVVQVRLIPVSATRRAREAKAVAAAAAAAAVGDQNNLLEQPRPAKRSRRNLGPLRHAGFAFVEFSHPREMEKAVREITSFPQKYRFMGHMVKADVERGRTEVDFTPQRFRIAKRLLLEGHFEGVRSIEEHRFAKRARRDVVAVAGKDEEVRPQRKNNNTSVAEGEKEEEEDTTPSLLEDLLGGFLSNYE